jgi:predicted transcriptional regulator
MKVPQTKIGKKIARETFTTRINPALLSELKHLAVDLKKPLSHLLEEAIVDFLQKYTSKK